MLYTLHQVWIYSPLKWDIFGFVETGMNGVRTRTMKNVKVRLPSATGS